MVVDYDGYRQVHPCDPQCRQRWRGGNIQYLLPSEPICKLTHQAYESKSKSVQINITNRDPREASLIEMRRFLSGDLESAGRHMRHGLESSKWAQALLKTIGVLAVSMVMSDGVLTPAQSVLGAVQGLEVSTAKQIVS